MAGIEDVPAASNARAENPWLVEQFRMTVFPAPGGPGTALVRDWWVETTGQPPERIQEDPRKGSIQLQSKHDDGQLFTTAEPERLDIRKLFHSPPDVPSSGPEYFEACEAFVELASRWLQLESLPQIVRLAFGVVVTNTPSSNLEDCREILAHYLPRIDMATVELRDFLFQGNRRRSSDVMPGVEVNRLTKWGVSAVQEVVVTPSGIAVQQHTTFSPRLELDINSVSGATLPGNRLGQLFKEFAKLADQIVENGDRS